MGANTNLKINGVLKSLDIDYPPNAKKIVFEFVSAGEQDLAFEEAVSRLHKILRGGNNISIEITENEIIKQICESCGQKASFVVSFGKEPFKAEIFYCEFHKPSDALIIPTFK